MPIRSLVATADESHTYSAHLLPITLARNFKVAFQANPSSPNLPIEQDNVQLMQYQCGEPPIHSSGTPPWRTARNTIERCIFKPWLVIQRYCLVSTIGRYAILFPIFRVVGLTLASFLLHLPCDI